MKPIIFSTPMVQAILDGRKTMTRRVVKFNESGRVKLRHKNWHIEDVNAVLGCPFGQVGDRLWVRETWANVTDYEGNFILNNSRKALYKADKESQILPNKWKPSIFMPRWASRITLEVTNIRVERLQEITVDDVFKEGIKIPPPYIGIGYDNMPIEHPDIAKHPTDYFAMLWDSINGKKYPWSSNSWVWVIEFRRLA